MCVILCVCQNLPYLRNSGLKFSLLFGNARMSMSGRRPTANFSLVVWGMRSGRQWRQLPKHYGKWHSAYKRFARWVEHGVWEHMHQHFTSDPDLASVIIDSTVVRAHSCAAGPQKKGDNPRKPSAEAGAGSAPKSTSAPMRAASHSGFDSPRDSPRSNPSRGVNRWV